MLQTLEKPPPAAPQKLVITPPAFRTMSLKVTGVAPYMQARFSEKARQAMAAKMLEGGVSQKRKTRSARNFQADYEAAMYRLPDGGFGIPASAFRAAAISACRLVGFKMTLAKLSLFIESDGLDTLDATPLVRLEGEPERSEMTVRNATGVADIRVRPLWRNWSATVLCRFDTEQFSEHDVLNLFLRVGAQVGIGEGRPDSKSSNGLGFGMFSVDPFVVSR